MSTPSHNTAPTPLFDRIHQSFLRQGMMQQLGARLDRVAALRGAGVLRAEVRAALKPLADLERIANRVLGGKAALLHLDSARPEALRRTPCSWARSQK